MQRASAGFTCRATRRQEVSVRSSGNFSIRNDTRGKSSCLRQLHVLDKVAGGSCFHDFPLFCSMDDHKNSREVIMVNRYWPELLDCLRWLALRRWWTRVWTVQEAVLPRADPFVYIGSYTFRLSRLIGGIKCLMSHSVERCCQNIPNMFFANYQNFSLRPLLAVMEISEYQEKFMEGSGPCALHASDIIQSSRKRQATAPRDHVFGMLGLMPTGTAEHFQKLGYSLSSAELFSQYTKILRRTLCTCWEQGAGRPEACTPRWERRVSVCRLVLGGWEYVW